MLQQILFAVKTLILKGAVRHSHLPRAQFKFYSSDNVNIDTNLLCCLINMLAQLFRGAENLFGLLQRAGKRHVINLYTKIPFQHSKSSCPLHSAVARQVVCAEVG